MKTENEQQGTGESREEEWRRTRLLMRRPWLDDLPEPPALPPEFEVRPARHDEVGGLASLLSRAFDEVWSKEQVCSVLLDATDVEETYVIASGDRSIATASSRIMPLEFPGSGYLHWVAVDPDSQGRGLGTLITLRVLERFKEDGLTDAVLETQTFRLPAIRTYLKLGFVPEYPDPEGRRKWADILPRLMR